jgi:hypothetical protein
MSFEIIKAKEGFIQRWIPIEHAADDPEWSPRVVDGVEHAMDNGYPVTFQGMVLCEKRQVESDVDSYYKQAFERIEERKENRIINWMRYVDKELDLISKSIRVEVVEGVKIITNGLWAIGFLIVAVTGWLTALLYHMSK